MLETTETANYRDLGLILRVLGGLMLLGGVAAAFLGPVEMYCFYLFAEGGPFTYEGFGFGAFMFGNIATQILGYYVLAALLIPLGYGHLKLRRWARPFALTLLWSWFVVGAPLTVVVMLITMTSKDPSLTDFVVVLFLLGLLYPIAPGGLIWFYRNQHVRLTFEGRDPQVYWVNEFPLPILVLGFLFLFYAIVLHVPILFNGIFPLFGTLLFGLEGIFVLDLAILGLLLLIWGTLRLRPWAWWGALAYFGLMIASSFYTLSISSLSDILAGMRFAPLEMEALQNVPLQGWHLAVFFGLSLVITFGLIVYSKRYFVQAHENG